MMMEGVPSSPGASSICSVGGSPYGPPCFHESPYPEAPYPEFRPLQGRSPRKGRGSRTGRQPEFDTLEVRLHECDLGL